MSPDIAADPRRMAVTVAFARYCLPTMFFMGVHFVLGQILNARGRFGAMMWTPVLNNIVIIATFGDFIWAFGGFTDPRQPSTITPEGVRLLGIGTLLGLAVQALAMLPYVRDAGFTPPSALRLPRARPGQGHGPGQMDAALRARQPARHGRRHAARHQGGRRRRTRRAHRLRLHRLQLRLPAVADAAGDHHRLGDDCGAAHGCPARPRTASRSVRDDLSYGLRTSAVAIVPCAFAFLALGVPMAALLYAGSGAEGAQGIGYVLMAFGLGLIPYSAQYVMLRGFYAYEDTRTPFYNTVSSPW